MITVPVSSNGLVIKTQLEPHTPRNRVAPASALSWYLLCVFAPLPFGVREPVNVSEFREDRSSLSFSAAGV